MDRKKLEYFRKLLTETLNSLSREASRTSNDAAEREDSAGDFTDQASAATDRTFVLRMQDRDWKLAAKIREALERIENGTYGICEECGQKISEKRLMARPVTTLCIDCKTAQEEEERRRGE